MVVGLIAYHLLNTRLGSYFSFKAASLAWLSPNNAWVFASDRIPSTVCFATASSASFAFFEDAAPAVSLFRFLVAAVVGDMKNYRWSLSLRKG